MRPYGKLFRGFAIWQCGHVRVKSRTSRRKCGPMKCRHTYAMNLWKPGCPANGVSWISLNKLARSSLSSGMSRRKGISRVTRKS